jgi:hypothetical protein
MSFLEDAEKESNSRYANRGCGVPRLLDQLSAIEWQLADEVAQALARPDLTTAGIRRALVARHHPGDSWAVPSQSTLERHRKGGCSCPNA